MFVHTFTSILAKKLFGNDLLPEIAKNHLTSPNYYILVVIKVSLLKFNMFNIYNTSVIVST